MRSDLDFINLGDRSYLGTRSTWLGQSTNKPEQIADRLIQEYPTIKCYNFAKDN